MWQPAFHTNMNFPAPLAVLGFLAEGGGLIVMAFAVAVAYFVRRPKVATWIMKLSATATVAYLGLLLCFSIASRDTLLVPGQEKYFCEIDCHLAYTVLDFKSTKEAAAEYYAITLRTRFDESTISSHRPKDYPLTPSPRTVLLTDAGGRSYASTSTTGTPLVASLIPGQSYTTELEFSVPSTAKGLRLLIRTTPAWPDHFVIGDENSWLHKKTYFQLETTTSARSDNRKPAAAN